MPDDVWLIDLDTNKVSDAHKDLMLCFWITVLFYQYRQWEFKNVCACRLASVCFCPLEYRSSVSPSLGIQRGEFSQAHSWWRRSPAHCYTTCGRLRPGYTGCYVHQCLSLVRSGWTWKFCHMNCSQLWPLLFLIHPASPWWIFHCICLWSCWEWMPVFRCWPASFWSTR